MRNGSSGSGVSAGFSSANMAATWRLVVPWMRVSAHLSFPVIQIGLRLFQALKAQAFQGCVLGVPDAALDFPLPIRIGDAARQRDGAVVGEHVAIQTDSSAGS